MMRPADGDATVVPQPALGAAAAASNHPGPQDVAQDFDGEVATSDALPSPATLQRIATYTVLDKYDNSHPLRNLYTSGGQARRTLFVFVRHFFCGNCQEFLRSLAEAIAAGELAALQPPTCVVVIGCGDPALIDMYVEATRCPFAVYTDPTRQLFDALGMVKTLAMGAEKPAYMRKGMVRSVLDSVGQALRHVPSGMALKSGDQRQVGGEFLFETREERGREGGEKEKEEAGGVRVTWCHRMKTTRDHTAIPELREILGLKARREG